MKNNLIINNEMGTEEEEREEKIEGEGAIMSNLLENVMDAEHLLEKIILFNMPLPFHEDV